jgi:serine/threonine-protein kinase
MATVYLAQDLKHKRRVAIKVLGPERTAQLGAERCITEIRTTAARSHSHILPLLESGSVPGPDKSGPGLCQVMPSSDGATLRDTLDRETHLGVIHRDRPSALSAPSVSLSFMKHETLS